MRNRLNVEWLITGKDFKMETKDCILTRRSIRKYTDEKISKKQLEEIVALAAYAPSWKNTQVTKYCGVLDSDIKAKIADECVLGFEFNQKIINRAAALVAVIYSMEFPAMIKTANLQRQKVTSGRFSMPG